MREREGGDVHFILNVRVLSTFIQRPQRPISRYERSILSLRNHLGQEDLSIPQSEWVKMLDEMGYERLRVMEIPIPEPATGTIIDSSLQHVENALKSFNEGDYDDVLVNCRMALEELERADLDLVSLLASESKKEKIDAIEKKVKDFLSLGPHPGVKIDRRDAELALAS